MKFLFYICYKKKSTTAGFEPTLPMENSLAGSRLNHSAKLSFSLLYFIIIIIFLFISDMLLHNDFANSHEAVLFFEVHLAFFSQRMDY